MFKKNKSCNPWVTFVCAMLSMVFAIACGCLAITGIQQKDIWLIVASAFFFVVCFSDCVKLLLRANAESGVYYGKKA